MSDIHVFYQQQFIIDIVLLYIVLVVMHCATFDFFLFSDDSDWQPYAQCHVLKNGRNIEIPRSISGVYV